MQSQHLHVYTEKRITIRINFPKHARLGQKRIFMAENQTPRPDIGSKEWYQLSSQEALERVKSPKEGLSSREVQKRLEQYGKNKLPTKKAPSLFTLILRQFKSPLIYILLIAGIISLVIGSLEDAVFIFIVVLINAVVGTIQEFKAEKSAEALQKMIQAKATVLRDGEVKRIDAEMVVPGDIVHLESGNRVPCDCRIITERNLGIDESILTGESTTSQKQTGVIEEEEVETGDQANMVFAGTSVISGRAEVVAVETGFSTQLGKISEAVTQTKTGELPLVQRMNRFVKQLSYIILGAVFVLAGITFARGTPLIEVFFMAVALAVSAIPAGLPVAMTIALSIGVNRMARRKVIIRKLPSVEGLGSCTYIASDKTGTLTSNIQTVRKVALCEQNGFQSVDVTGQGYTGEGKLERDGKEPDKHVMKRAVAFARAGVLCNGGSLIKREGSWKHDGDPIDVALLAFGYKAGLETEKVKRETEIQTEIPYESERKYQAVFYREQDGSFTTAVKGATEAILQFCKFVPSSEGKTEIDPGRIHEMEAQLTNQGFRVLAVASGKNGEPSDLQNPQEEDIPDLTFLGLVGFIDPLRPEAKGAVEECKKAGVKVGMITGDHPRTALAIAKNLGIAQNESELASGKDLEKTKKDNEEEFNKKVRMASVFARINPLQKVDIVSSLVSGGEFVAVTGDGVNDAPALRKANLGVAMGSGNDVAKDTGSIIIADDNFASIVSGIEQGRIAYQNLRKVIYLLIATGAAEVILFTFAVALGMPIPLVAVQLLWLNLVTNGVQHVGLAFEKGEAGVMKNAPRDPKERIFNPQMIQETIVAGATMAFVGFGLWWWLMSQEVEVVYARNLMLLLMVLFENYHVFNCRSELESVLRVPFNNPILFLGVAAGLSIHILSLYMPVLQDVLQTSPVTLTQFGLVLALGASVVVTTEVFKAIRRRKLSKETEK